MYLVPVSSTASLGLCPLQDTSAQGSNIVAQLEAEQVLGLNPRTQNL